MLSCGVTSAHAIAAFCWRITRHNTLAALADLYPQWLVRDLLPLPPSGGIPREATRSLNPPSSASLRAQGCGTVVAALKDRHQGRDGRGLGNSNRRSPWLRLAPSPAPKIKTLSLNIKARFLPAEPSENEKAPNLRVMAGNVEIGAAWQRTSKDNTIYHSVKLDDPSFSAPIYAKLVAVDDGYALVWSR
jgi:uncharacterized protein (DUF736 family)